MNKDKGEGEQEGKGEKKKTTERRKGWMAKKKEIKDDVTIQKRCNATMT